MGKLRNTVKAENIYEILESVETSWNTKTYLLIIYFLDQSSKVCMVIKKEDATRRRVSVESSEEMLNLRGEL